MKFPSDLILYHQEIWKNKPDFIIECGCMYGGSSVFFGDMLDIVGKGRVISIDIVHRERPKHPRVSYITGSSIDPEVVDVVSGMIGPCTCMVVLDSVHTADFVKDELELYSPMVSVGQWLVVEDARYVAYEKGPGIAIDQFLQEHTEYERIDITEQFISCVGRDGWLKRIKQ